MSDIAMKVSARSMVGKIIRLPLKLLPSGSVMRVVTGPLRGARWVAGAGVHGCWLGIYEADKQKHYVEHIRPSQTVFDIGAHVGFYTLLSARLVGPGGRVFAFEPSPRNVPKLKRHLELNDSKNVTLLACAVADKPGEMGFEFHAGNDGGYMGRISASGTVKVRVESIDGLLSTGAITPAHLVKIDVEGAERLVLEGGRGFFTTHKPTIFLATHGEVVHKECCDLLQSWGYELSSLEPGVDLTRTREVLAVARTTR